MSSLSYKFFIVAPGKVGQAIGKILIQQGHTCLGVWSRREEGALRAASFLQAPAHWGQPFPESLREADVVLLTSS